MKEKFNKAIDRMAKFGYDHYKFCEYFGAAAFVCGLWFYGLGYGMEGFRKADEYWSKAAQDVLNKVDDK